MSDMLRMAICPKVIKTLFVLVLLLINPACSLLEIDEQVKTIEKAGVITGRVIVTVPMDGPVIVRLYHLEKRVFVSDTQTILTQAGEFHIHALPDVYYIAAFVDRNRDGQYQKDENGNYYQTPTGKPAPIELGPGEAVDAGTLRISGKSSEVDGYTDVYLPEKVIANLGATTSLDNPSFSRDNSALGMWKPLQFLDQVGGGLFLLQEYQANKIPVLFVHGLEGTPLDWRSVIAGLNRDRFQPWVIYYPSGFRLDMISDYLVKALVSLHDRYEFSRIIIAAHSMGGLVALSAIRKTFHRHPEAAATIRLLVTVNSPLGGMESAAMGVRNSPIVLPVWRDLDPGSRFMLEMNAWFLPKDIPYHLFFSYVNGRSDDTVVPLVSQIPLQQQLHATRIYGFRDSHTGTLADEEFHQLFHSILDGVDDQHPDFVP